MEAVKKRSIAAFAPWMASNICLYLLAYMNHLQPVRWAAFFALFLSVFFFALRYRSNGAEQTVATKYGGMISAWATFLAGFLYLYSSGWRP
jgi:hypothetical protein